jgi:hypothetical protein
LVMLVTKRDRWESTSQGRYTITVFLLKMMA